MAESAQGTDRPLRRGWLLQSFIRRELLNRYAGSASGALWTLINPLAQLAVYAFVFSQVFRAAVPPEFPGVGYTAFVAVALWPWILFYEGLQRAMGCVTANAGLVRKVAFPHRYLVYAAVVSNALVQAAGFLAVLIALRLWGEPIRFSGLPLAALLLVPYLLLATGLGAALAAFQTVLRDVEQGVPVALTMLFYATPILYPASLVPASLREGLSLNPLAWFSERLRAVLLQGAGPEAGDLGMALACAAVAAAGLWIFERLSPHFEELL